MQGAKGVAHGSRGERQSGEGSTVQLQALSRKRDLLRGGTASKATAAGEWLASSPKRGVYLGLPMPLRDSALPPPCNFQCRSAECRFFRHPAAAPSQIGSWEPPPRVDFDGVSQQWAEDSSSLIRTNICTVLCIKISSRARRLEDTPLRSGNACTD